MANRKTIETFITWLNEFRARTEIKNSLNLIQYFLLILVIGFLVWRFSQVGWLEVFDALPTSPWFYVFFALRFLALPLSEMIIYQMIWDIPLFRHFPVFLRKRVYNFAVMGYSGEGSLTLWARRNLPLENKEIIVGVKDNNLLSALTSNIATVILIVWLFSNNGLSVGVNALPSGGALLFALAFTSASALSLTVIALRKRLIALPLSKLRRVMSIHAVRMILILLLHVGMYAAALPGASLSAWAVFLALQLVLSRIPFIPNQDLVFMGAALSLSSLVHSSEAALAGMLLAEAGLSQLINIALFFATAYLARQHH